MNGRTLLSSICLFSVAGLAIGGLIQWKEPPVGIMLVLLVIAQLDEIIFYLKQLNERNK